VLFEDVVRRCLESGGGHRVLILEPEIGSVDRSGADAGRQDGEDFGVFASIFCFLQEWYQAVEEAHKRTEVSPFLHIFVSGDN
jgi:hypothetical protein